MGSVRSTRRLEEEELDTKVRKFPNDRNATIDRHVFVRRLPRGNRCTDVAWHDLESLYEL